MKILFILKKRYYHNTNINSYGLINSATEIANFLETLPGINTKIVTVIDGNCIDKEVHDYRPDIVIIEALWVTGDKLKELIEIRRYHHIKWVVRIHSDIGYLSAETLALKYINDYIDLHKHNLYLAPNNEEFCEYLSKTLHYKFEYLPNIVEFDSYNIPPGTHDRDIINIGCFGALRILKNHLFQAMCAMEAADQLGKTLHFHVNDDTNKQETKLNPVLTNLEELFSRTKHKLVVHPWLQYKEFQELIQKMDIGLQLSYTESFNIVTANFIANDRLIIVSNSIDWMPKILKTSTTNYDKVVKKIIWLYRNRNSWLLRKIVAYYLYDFNKNSQRVWEMFLWQLK